jgi:hypothetical protein
VFRIHDILVWIRIRGSMSLTIMDPDPNADPDPAIFVIDLQGANKKLFLKKSFSVYYLLKVHLYHFSKIKSPKEVTTQWESRFFLLFLHDDRRIRIRTSD